MFFGLEKRIAGRYNGGKGVMGMRCPRCLSTSLIMYRDENRNTYLRIRAVGLLGVLLLDKLHEADMKKRGGELCKCQACGFQWYAQKGELLEKYFVHLKPQLQKENGGFYDVVSYPAVNGTRLRLRDDCVIFSRPYRRDRRLSYETIVDVKQTEEPSVGYGWLTIRYRKNRGRPYPANIIEAKRDRYTVIYHLNNAVHFNEAYFILGKIIEENKNAGTI